MGTWPRFFPTCAGHPLGSLFVAFADTQISSFRRPGSSVQEALDERARGGMWGTMSLFTR